MSAREQSRYDADGERQATSARWAVERLNPPNRLWGSNATWSQQSPRKSSAGSLARQFFCFLPT